MRQHEQSASLSLALPTTERQFWEHQEHSDDDSGCLRTFEALTFLRNRVYSKKSLLL